VGNEAVDQLAKFNRALVDHSEEGTVRTIDGILLTKFDTIDDKVGYLSHTVPSHTVPSHTVPSHTVPSQTQACLTIILASHTLTCTPAASYTHSPHTPLPSYTDFPHRTSPSDTTLPSYTQLPCTLSPPQA